MKYKAVFFGRDNTLVHGDLTALLRFITAQE